MNIPMIIRVAQVLFKLRKIIALAVILEFAIKRQLNSSNKKSKGNKHAGKELQSLADDAVNYAQSFLQSVRKQLR